MRYTVDRVEGAYAVCQREDGGMEDIPLAALPFEAREGLRFTNDQGVYALLPDDGRSDRVRLLMDVLFDPPTAPE